MELLKLVKIVPVIRKYIRVPGGTRINKQTNNTGPEHVNSEHPSNTLWPCMQIAQKGSKIVYLCQKVPFLRQKFIVIGPKIIDNDTGKFVRLSAFR
jgi:hypothetical protein